MSFISNTAHDPSLPYKPCRLTTHLADKVYTSAGEAASARHAMAVLQVFQAKVLQSIDGSSTTVDAMKDVQAATDLF